MLVPFERSRNLNVEYESGAEVAENVPFTIQLDFLYYQLLRQTYDATK